jgi:hypothetical protein
MVLMLL